MAEELHILEPFDDISPPVPQQQKNAFLSGDQNLSNINAISIGGGTKVLHADQSGLWLGADKFSNAPFSVDMQGNVILKAAGSGTAGLFLSGTGRTIIVNDGSNDRILIGYQSGGF